MDAQLWSNGGTSIKAVIPSGKNVFFYEFDFCNSSFDEVPTPHSTFTLPAPVYTATVNPLDTALVCGCEDSLIYRLDHASNTVLGRLGCFIFDFFPE